MMSRKKGGIAIAATFLIAAALNVTMAELVAAIPPLELVSRADPSETSATAGANLSQQLNQRAFSADGRYVVFISSAENIIEGLSEDHVTANVFLHDRVTNTTVLVSHAVGSPTTAANADSFVPTLSGDGRFVVYWTFASDVVANQNDDGLSTPDVFIYDRTTGENRLVSHIPGAPTTTGDSNSYDPTVNGDGRYVSFTSAASNLVAGQADGGSFSNIFVWDRINDTVTLVTHKNVDPVTTATGSAFNSVLSDDGAFVAFMSNGSNLIAGQSQSAARYQIFLWNRNTGDTSLVSHTASSATTAGNNSGLYPVMNANASYIAFYSSATDLVAGQFDQNQNHDVFLYERATGTNTLISHTQNSTSTTGLMASLYPEISSDGRYVVYQSTAPDLVANDLNNVQDIFVWDRTTNSNTLVSRSATSPISASANARSYGGQISGDGQTISFTSEASDLLPGQTASVTDVFFLDRTNSSLHLISHVPGSTSTGGDDGSALPLLSADGAFVAYTTAASNLVPNDKDGSADVMLYDRAGDTNTAASLRPANLASISANGHSGSHRASTDGRFVVFTSEATNLVPNQSDMNAENDIFVRDRQNNTTTLVSHAAGSPGTTGDGHSDTPAISTDGRWITYVSNASTLVDGMINANGGYNIYLYDRVNDVTMLISHSVVGANFSASDWSETPAISGDGRFVTYSSYAVDLVTGQSDSNGDHDVFVFDRTTGLNALVSHDSAAPNLTGIYYSFAPSISIDGKFIAFYSAATDLVPNQGNGGDSVQHLFLYDRAANSNTVVDHQYGIVATSGDGNAGSTEPLDPAVFSADSYYIAYASSSTNLVSGQTDNNSNYDIFLFDRAAGTNILVSHRPDSPTTTGDDISYNPSINADGRIVSYRSQSTDLVPGQVDTNSFQDVFVFDRITRANTLVSHAFGKQATAGNGLSGEAPRYGYQSVSPDGRFVAFWSSSTDLIQNDVDQNGFNGDLFLYDRFSGANILLTHALGAPSTGGNNGSGDSQHTGGPVWSGDGHFLMFASRASDLINDDFNNREDVFALNVPLLPVSVVSRKTHGSAGTFDINLPIAGTPGIECRGSGSTNDYTLVFTFPNNLTSVDNVGVSATGPPQAIGASGSIGPNQNQYTVNLTGVPDGQYLTVTLNNVLDSQNNSSNVPATMGVLLGDVNASGVVTSGDTNLCKAQALQTVTNGNFRNDINASGNITTGDVNLIKQNALKQLPSSP
jgi:hypothetical protein